MQGCADHRDDTGALVHVAGSRQYSWKGQHVQKRARASISHAIQLAFGSAQMPTVRCASRVTSPETCQPCYKQGCIQGDPGA